MFKAGWWACRVFELLLKVSGKYDLRGEFSENYANPDWLAREWNYTREDASAEPGESVSYGIDALLDHGILQGTAKSFILVGWEEFYGKKDYSTPRVRKMRANRNGDVGTAAATGETDETDETTPTPPTHTTSPTELMRLWNLMAQEKGLTRCLKLAGERERLTIARLKEQPDLTYWAKVAYRIADSDFCTGKNDREWKASYDWFVHPLTHAKVMEGKYDNRGPSSTVKLVTINDNLYGDGT
jgi:hypothetical protein